MVAMVGGIVVVVSLVVVSSISIAIIITIVSICIIIVGSIPWAWLVVLGCIVIAKDDSVVIGDCVGNWCSAIIGS